MRPSAILRSLSLRILVRPSASRAVAPLPVLSSFDQQITAELNALQLQRGLDINYTSATRLLQALHASTLAHKITLESLVHVHHIDSNRKAIEDYLEDSTELLDACNGLLEQMDIIHKYTDSLRVVLHLLEGKFEPNPTTLVRARVMLDSCEAKEMDKCESSSGLRKLDQKLAKVGWHDSELSEMLSGSKAVSLMVCGLLGMALSVSFRSKCGYRPTMQGRPRTSWSSSLHELQKGIKQEISQKHKCSASVMLTELRRTVLAARELRDQMKCRKQNEYGLNVEELKRSCGELVGGIKDIAESVKELYRHLISVTMRLLGILSHA